MYNTTHTTFGGYRTAITLKKVRDIFASVNGVSQKLLQLGTYMGVGSFDRAPQTVLWIEKFRFQNSKFTVITVKFVKTCF